MHKFWCFIVAHIIYIFHKQQWRNKIATTEKQNY